jgi:hypothetical protein
MSETISLEINKKINKKNLTFILSIPKPDKAVIKEYSDRFHNRSNNNNVLLHEYERSLSSKVSDYAVAEKILTDLFQKEPYKDNTDLEKIITKVVLLNTFYSTRIDSNMLIPIARQIMATRIDDKLINYSTDSEPVANCDLVNAIAYCRTPINNWGDGIDNRYSFASKYCSWHQPDLYPIVDSYAKGLLIHLLDVKLNSTSNDEEVCFTYEFPPRSHNGFAAKNKILSDYHQYFRAYMTFINKYGLNDIKLKDIDEYLWTLARSELNNDNCRVQYQEKVITYTEYKLIAKQSYSQKDYKDKVVKTIADLVKAESDYPEDLFGRLKEKYPSFKAICDECKENGIDWSISINN